jgi:hypothetical protein
MLVLWIYWNFPELLFCDSEEPTRKGNPKLLKSSNIIHDADVPFFQFIYYKERNLLPTTLTHLAHKDNLILLCANCETEFDNSMPALTFIPTKIEYFINYEVSDYERRTVAASSGVKKPRTVPSGQEYANSGGKFKAIQLQRDRKMVTEEKEWGGAPGAIILRAAIGLLQPFVQEDGDETGIPKNALSQFAKLMQLYSRPDPKCTRAFEDIKQRSTSPTPPPSKYLLSHTIIGR